MQVTDRPTDVSNYRIACKLRQRRGEKKYEIDEKEEDSRSDAELPIINTKC